MNKPAPDFKRILIIATRQIGDVLCTTPLMRRARELWPDAVIDVLGYEKTMGMLAGNPDIDEVIESPEHPNWKQYKKLVRKIFRRYDLAVITQPSDRAHFYGLLAARRRVGLVPSSRGQSWWKRLHCVHSIPLNYFRQHVIFERLKLLDVFSKEQRISVVVSPPRVATDLLPPVYKEAATPYVVIHPSPRFQFKEWPVDFWCELIAKLVEKEFSIVLTGGPNARDRLLAEDIKKSLALEHGSRLIDLTGTLTFENIVNLLEGAHSYVGVDTAVTHLAASTGVNTVALFGPTPPSNFGPCPPGLILDTTGGWTMWENVGALSSQGVLRQRNKNVTILQGATHSCVPCRRMGCEDNRTSSSDCLDKISPDAVLEEVIR